MFISPKKAIEEKWITFPKWMDEEQQHKCIQPNAIDFTLDHLYTVPDECRITEQGKEFSRSIPVQTIDASWTIDPNAIYDGLSDFYVEVPEGVACMLINRSSFNRAGIHLNSGLYDSGFSGNIGFTLYNRSPTTTITTESGTRVGQIIFIQSDSAGQYSGGYSTKQGEHWANGE